MHLGTVTVGLRHHMGWLGDALYAWAGSRLGFGWVMGAGREAWAWLVRFSGKAGPFGGWARTAGWARWLRWAMGRRWLIRLRFTIVLGSGDGSMDEDSFYG